MIDTHCPKLSPNYILSAEEITILQNALYNARCDIFQTARVAEYNLTGKDPIYPDDSPPTRPNPPKLITRNGLDESYTVYDEVCEALKMLWGKTKDCHKLS